MLLIREDYGLRRYGLPGGRVERYESPAEAVVREAREETGLAVQVIDLVGVYGAFGEKQHVAYAYLCEILDGRQLLRPAR